jgi:RNA recognition motif-containing protein
MLKRKFKVINNNYKCHNDHAQVPDVNNDIDTFMDHDGIEVDDFKPKPIARTFRRTIQNDMYWSRSQTPAKNPEPDIFDCYVVPTRPSSLTNMKIHPRDPRRYTVRNVDHPNDHDDRFLNDRYVIMQAQPKRNESAGIFAQTGGPTKVVVGNLHSGVTLDEVTELFSDIGTVIGSKMICPGTAEVIYDNYGDAERAVDRYHNRSLDNQPMKCYLNASKVATL